MVVEKTLDANAIYGGLLVFALYSALPDQPPVSELENFVQHMFMAPFTKLGKVFNLNRPRDRWLIDKVFRKSGNRDRRDAVRYPDGFINAPVAGALKQDLDLVVGQPEMVIENQPGPREDAS